MRRVVKNELIRDEMDSKSSTLADKLFIIVITLLLFKFSVNII